MLQGSLYKIDLHGLLPDLALQLGHPALLRAFLPRTGEGTIAVIAQLPSPALQIAGVHFQGARHLAYTLSALDATDSRLFEFLAEFPASFHSPVFPFNDFQGLTGCLKNGVHSSLRFTRALLPIR